MEEKDKAIQTLMDKGFEAVANLFGEEDGKVGQDENIQALAAMLALDDEEFSLLQELFLESFEKTINAPEARAQLIASVRESGQDPKESLAEFAKFVEELESGELKDILSEIKRDFLLRFFSIIANLFSEVADDLGVLIPVELSEDCAKIPLYANPTDAGLDVFATEEIVLNPGETKLVKLGIKMAIPNGYELQVRPRSGLSLKTPLRVANAPGTIDSGYRGEVAVIITNTEAAIQDIQYSFNPDNSIKIESILHGSSYTITKGMKIAQIVLAKVSRANFFPVKSINEFDGDRGGGFGSTGN